MIKKIAPALGVVVMLIVLFLISFNMTRKITADKAENNTTLPQSSEPVPFTQPSFSDPENTTAEVGTTDAVEGTSAAEPSADDTLPEPTVINMPADAGWSVVLINRYYKMNDTYEPLVQAVLDDSGIYLDERVAEKYREMYAAALADGVTLVPAAGYISPERQDRKFTKQVDLYVAEGMTEEAAKAKASFTVLPAGCNESNYGLAVDIGWQADDFADSPAYAWLQRNAAEYGFVERYKADKTEYTHFTAQPWHWRYVGADAAQAMNEQGLCLEEYLGKVN